MGGFTPNGMGDFMLKRNLNKLLVDSLQWSPVILLIGPRQAGKTTLVKRLAEDIGYSYISFDNLRILSAARQDPIGFVASLTPPVIIDEIQRVPEIFLPIKEDVDKNRHPGRYVLTGSANPLEIKGVGDSLAGRMLIFPLYPFSQGEVNSRVENFIETVFDKKYEHKLVVKQPDSSALPLKQKLYALLVAGGFPEIVNAPLRQRSAWFDAYLTTRLQKDITELACIDALTVLPDLMALLAARTGALLNIAELARSSKIPMTTLQRYMALLRMLYLIETVQPWSANLAKRLVKAPKMYLIDTGLAAHLLGVDQAVCAANHKIFGSLLENFVVNELTKQISWSTVRVKLFHFRTSSGVEVDLILEGPGGAVVGIEIKSSDTVKADDFKGLKQLQEMIGANFLCGIVLYTGEDSMPFGPGLYAMPVSALWEI